VSAPRAVRAWAVVVSAALLGVTAPAPHALADVTWAPRLRPAVQWAEGRAGDVSIAVIGTDRRLHGHRAAAGVPAASVLKVMYMVAYLRQPWVRGRALTDRDRSLLRPMITRSANAPATAIANQIGPAPMNRLARRAGMRDFAYRRPWGLTTTSARDQVRFMLDLERHLPDRHRRYALYLLRNIVPAQRWGIGRVQTPAWRQHVKGGWGSGRGAVDHQVVLLTGPDQARVALAVMTTNSPRHAYGKRTLRGVFARILRTLPTGRVPRVAGRDVAARS
jgi:hypothetical protein